MNYSGLVRFCIHMVWFLVLTLFPLACSNGKGNTTVNAGANVDPHADTPITATTVNAGANVDPHADTPITAIAVPRIQKGMTITQLREAVRDFTPWRCRLKDEDHEDWLAMLRTLDDWKKLARDLEPTLEHQFTIARNGDIITCVAAQLFDFDRSLMITFVFRNGTLEKFMPDPPYQWTQDGPGAVKLVTDPEARIEEILQTAGFSDEALISYITENAQKRIAKWRKPLIAEAGSLAILRVHFLQCEKFDGLKVSLGMSVNDVNALFGAPKLTQESDSGTRRIYGSKVGDVRWPYPPVLVEFTEDQARGVLSGPHFIDLEQYLGPPWPELRRDRPRRSRNK